MSCYFVYKAEDDVVRSDCVGKKYEMSSATDNTKVRDDSRIGPVNKQRMHAASTQAQRLQ